MNVRRTNGVALVAAMTALAACAAAETEESAADDAATEGAEAAPRAVRVTIREPAHGETYEGSVRIVLVTEGIEIAPVAEARPGTAHHHLFVDVDLTPLGDMIPAGDSSIIHLGGGQTEHVLEGLAAGSHRVIALLADPAHIPLDPPAGDTVEFVIR